MHSRIHKTSVVIFFMYTCLHCCQLAPEFSFFPTHMLQTPCLLNMTQHTSRERIQSKSYSLAPSHVTSNYFKFWPLRFPLSSVSYCLVIGPLTFNRWETSCSRAQIGPDPPCVYVRTYMCVSLLLRLLTRSLLVVVMLMLNTSRLYLHFLPTTRSPVSLGSLRIQSTVSVMFISFLINLMLISRQ